MRIRTAPRSILMMTPFLLPVCAQAGSWTNLTGVDRVHVSPHTGDGTYVGIGVIPAAAAGTQAARLHIEDVTTRPNALLKTLRNYGASVSGSYIAHDLSASYGATSTGSITGLKVTVGHGGGGGQAYSAIFRGGRVGIGTDTPTENLQVEGRIRTVYNTWDILWGDTHPNSTGGVTLNNKDFGIRTQTTGNSMLTVKIDGRIGIGTVAPSAFLQVSGAGVGGGTSGIDITNTVTGGRTYKLSSGIKNQNEAGFTIMDRTAGDAHRLVIDASGSIGIGTTTPQAKLDIVGGSGIRHTDGVNGIMTMAGDHEGAKVIVDKFNTGTRDFRVIDAAKGETFRVTEDGQLAVKGQGFATWLVASKTIYIGDVMGGDDSRAGASGENLIFRTKDRDVAAFNSLGWFATGNSSNPSVTNAIPAPRTELDIRDSYTDSENRAELWLTGSTGGGGVVRFWEFNGSRDVEEATIRSDDPENPDGLSFQTGGTVTNGPNTRMRLKANGDLVLNGTLDVTGVKTKAWHMPDYVFEKDYKLASLEEVDAFVKKNKHLPEVPSAKQVAQEGIDLAKMNLVLLKKVEELTLHAIRQEQRLKSQDSRIESLQKALSGRSAK